MKKNIWMLTAATTLVCSVYAQDGHRFYVKADAGYATSMVNEQMLIEDDTHDPDNKHSSVNGTLSDGFKASLGVGYMFNPSFGVEIGGVYSAGNTLEATNKVGFTIPGWSYWNATEIKNTSGLVYLNAKMVLNKSEIWKPYARLGLTTNVYSKTKKDVRMTVDSSSNYNATSDETVYKLSLGVNGALGCSYHLSERLSVYAELNALIMSLSKKKNTITKYDINGQDFLPSLSTYEKEIEYKRKGTVSTTPDMSKPQVQTSQFDPLSYAGLSVGIQFSF